MKKLFLLICIGALTSTIIFAGRDKFGKGSGSYPSFYSGYPRERRPNPALERARARSKVAEAFRQTFPQDEAYQDFLNQPSKIDRPDGQGKMTVGEILNQGFLDSFVEAGNNLKVSDAIVRAFLGEDWEALEDLNMGTGSSAVLKAVGVGMLFRGVGAFGDQLARSVEGSCRGFLDFIFLEVLGRVGTGVKSYWYAIRNRFSGHSGQPFTERELWLWRQSINKILSDLERRAKNAGIMDARSRDKLSRLATGSDDEEAVDDMWIGQRESYERELEFVKELISRSRAYYYPEHDKQIVHYALQIEDLLGDTIENIIRPTKSYMSLGSSRRQSGIATRKDTLYLYFSMLIKLISPKILTEKDSSDFFGGGNFGGRRRRFSAFDDDDDAL